MAKKTTSAPTLDRRSFVAAGVAAGACLASGCAPQAKVGTGESVSYAEQGIYEGGLANTSLNDGEWKFLNCNKGCGGGCVNKVLIKDGKIVRTKTDDTHEDSLEYPQFRSCLRGRMAAEWEFGDDRLKYPLKRKHWSPEEPNGELRGSDEWERISWDEALDIIAEQLKKTYTTYGPRSVFKYDGFLKRSPVLDACGGYITTWDTASFGSYLSDLSRLGLPEVSMGGDGTINDRLDVIENAKLIVLYAQDPAWSAVAYASWNMRAAKENGAEFIVVGPFNNSSANMLGAKWIRVLPGTDTAFLLAVVYEMLRLDAEEGGIIDWDFLHKYCVGFDDESMPDDAKLEENIKGYVLGDYDGIPKTPEWATNICGTPVEDITYFAKAVRKDVDAVMSHGFAAGRAQGAEDIPQLYLTVACMGGHIGKPGNAYGPYWVDYSACGGPRLVKSGASGDGWDVSECTPLCDPKDVMFATLATDGQIPMVPDELVSSPEAHYAVLEDKFHDIGCPWGAHWKPIQEKECSIRVIYGEFSTALRSFTGIPKGIEAFKKADFVVMRDHSPKPDCCYADIVLPVSGRQGYDAVGGRGRESILYYTMAMEPLDEVKTDRWVDEQLLKRLGYDPEQIYFITPEQGVYNQLAGCAVRDENGDYSTLLTITQEDIDEMGIEGTPQEGIITLAEFKEKGIYTVQRHRGDAFTHIGCADFIADPEANPLPSNSGKFELYCQAKADVYEMISFSGDAIKPYPTYREIAGPDGYGLRCFNPHYPRTAGSLYNNVPALREAWPAPLLLNVNDATSEGIADGDDVLVSSPYGKVLRTACVTGLIMEGAIGLPNGLWVSMDEDGIDRGGSGNTLVGGRPTGMGISGYNGTFVKIEKWTGEPLQPDCEWQQTIEVTA